MEGSERMTEVKIHEGEYRTHEEYLKIKNDYVNGLLVKDLRKKYHMTSRYWQKTRKELEKETGIKRGKVSPNAGKGKYYYKNRIGKYVVTKYINDNLTQYYGTYSSQKIASKVVEELKKVDWDKSKLIDIRMKIILEEGTL